MVGRDWSQLYSHTTHNTLWLSLSYNTGYLIHGLGHTQPHPSPSINILYLQYQTLVNHPFVALLNHLDHLPVLLYLYHKWTSENVPKVNIMRVTFTIVSLYKFVLIFLSCCFSLSLISYLSGVQDVLTMDTLPYPLPTILPSYPLPSSISSPPLPG